MIVDGNNFISHYLKHNKVFAAGKIGITELKLLYSYYYNNKIPDKESFEEGFINSGIYPKTQETFIYFCEEYVKSIKCLDIAPIWGGVLLDFHRSLYEKLNPECYNTPLTHLEPYYFEEPWTNYLQDKKVLVISPFSRSIEQQYLKFEHIWNNKIKSNFSLDTVKFPLSRGLTESNEYNSYRDCLEKMKDKVSSKDFDFCIIGAGAYARPLCAHIKQMNRSCINLGGATQILFGIKGNRWSTISGISKFFNNNWVSPSGDEIPKKYALNEGGCYW
jgi:hypothetical protein